jgi:hypothetical protein
MSDKNFKVKNGLDANGTVTAIEFSGSGASLTSIPNSALTNSSITVNGSPVSLGGTVTIDALPSQSGNAGKFLTTDGSTASWAASSGGGFATLRMVADITGVDFGVSSTL